jgi:hypothetical protein
MQIDSLATKQILPIQIGDVCCAISCNDPEISNHLGFLFKDFISNQAADISIELRTNEGRTTAEVATALCDTRYKHEGGRFITTSELLAGTYDLSGHVINITGDRNLLDPELEYNLLNRLLCLGYYSACKIKYDGNPPALLVHGCGILRHGWALIFAGPSGSGKTTVARLCGERYGHTINDEILLVSRPDPDRNTLHVRGTPIVGSYSHHSTVQAPLRCILLLKKGPGPKIHELSKTEAYLRFMRQVIAPSYIGQQDRRVIYSLIADFSSEVVATTRFFELEFSLDPCSLWQSIEQLELSFTRETN